MAEQTDDARTAVAESTAAILAARTATQEAARAAQTATVQATREAITRTAVALTRAPTYTAAAILTATERARPTSTPTVTSTPTKTPTPVPSPTHDVAGASEWLTHDALRVGVSQIAWSYSLSYYRPESGKIFISLYLIATNAGRGEETFSPYDFGLVDGGGEVHGRLFVEPREPEFDECRIRPGGTCEGWWTTEIWDRAQVKENLVFRWSPSWFTASLETPIWQK